MAKTHYEVLGVTLTSTAEEIRSAYRRIVLEHHPDRSQDPKSKGIFLSATEAYEVLGDKDRRSQYDDRIAIEAKIQERRAQFQPGVGDPRTQSARRAEVRLDINRLNSLFSRGNFQEAEKLARSVIERDRRQSVPYAVLGDIERMKGNKGEAIKMYGYALQFDPRNLIYRQRYEELVEPRTGPVATVATPTIHRTQPKEGQMSGPLFGMGLILLACTYLIFSHEAPIVPWLKVVSTWTTGLVAMLFFSGVILGSCLALDGLLGSYSGSRSAGGRASPTLALASIAIVSYWVAVLMYVGLSLKWKRFDNSTSRIFASVTAGVCLLALASEASGNISGIQVFLWGGNLLYLGALCGWMVTDALRGSPA